MKAVSTAASTIRHTLGVALEALLLLAIVAALIFGSALLAGIQPAGADSVFAAKGGNGHGHGGTPASITVPDGVFAGTTTATANPGGEGTWVHAKCYQAGSLVLEQWRMVDSNNQATLNLGPTQLWQSGAADCTAEEGYFGNNSAFRVMAGTTFFTAAE